MSAHAFEMIARQIHLFCTPLATLHATWLVINADDFQIPCDIFQLASLHVEGICMIFCSISVGNVVAKSLL